MREHVSCRLFMIMRGFVLDKTCALTLDRGNPFDFYMIVARVANSPAI